MVDKEEKKKVEKPSNNFFIWIIASTLFVLIMYIATINLAR